MSVGKTSNDGNVSKFTDEEVQVYKEEDVLIICRGKQILIGKRDERRRYRISLMQTRGKWQPQTPRKKSKKFLQEANSVYDLPTTEEAIRWMHVVCGYPVKYTCIKAIKSGNFTVWLMLNKCNIAKYYPDSTETPKGHLNQTRKNVQSTKSKTKPFEKQTHQHYEVRKCETSKLKSMTSATQRFLTRPGSSPPYPNEATGTSWS